MKNQVAYKFAINQEVFTISDMKIKKVKIKKISIEIDLDSDEKGEKIQKEKIQYYTYIGDSLETLSNENQLFETKNELLKQIDNE